MIDAAYVSRIGSRQVNEDYVLVVEYEKQRCFIVCDGLGGHLYGDIAARIAAKAVEECFLKAGDYPTFFDDAFCLAQERILKIQAEQHMEQELKTTMVVLVVTDEFIKWAHIGDSRLYRFVDFGPGYFRTKDHSVVQNYFEHREIDEIGLRKHAERNKLERVLGSAWGKKSYDKSPIIEREDSYDFCLMTDGFWEYIDEKNMIEARKNSHSANEWLEQMLSFVEQHSKDEPMDNYSAITVRVSANSEG